MRREYKAWIIAGVFKAKPSLGLVQRGPFPMYKQIKEFLPFFASKRAAQEYCRSRRIKMGGALGTHIVRVTVVMDTAALKTIAGENP